VDPVYDYNSLLLNLKMRFQYNYPKDRRKVRMLGLCFARPTSNLAKNEIFPQVPDWHYRSGNYIDFYFAGFTDFQQEPETKSLQVSMPGRGTWFYSPKTFDSYRKQIEEKTNWKYSGGSDLILVNAYRKSDLDEPIIDFSNAIVCQLDAMKDAKAFISVEQYFEAIFRFSEEFSDNDPVWRFSDQQAVSNGVTALQRIALSLLPQGLSSEVEKMKHFAIKNIGRKSTD
jgi:hypothetical protein